MQTRPVVEREPLNTRDALYRGRTEAIRHHYKAGEGKHSILRCHVALSLHNQIFQVSLRPPHNSRG
jgi:hypothetical protein